LRESWYGDNRDLVKWAALLHLASEYAVQCIVQVAYLQSSNPPILEAGNVETAVPSAVWRHFRGLQQIQNLARVCGLTISLVDWPFSHRVRAQYAERLTKLLAEQGSPKLVLLDPDTGLAPERYDARHVTRADVKSVWHTLGHRDWLLLYQHARRSKGWVEDTHAEFRACCADEATIFRSRSTARDVVLFAARKLAI
jgi:hypothetical protein